TRADSLVAVSPLISAGRTIDSAPHSWATRAIIGSSVDTTMRLISGVARACATLYESSGWPASRRMFFLGTPFDPPRAGIMARQFIACSPKIPCEEVHHT